MSSARGVCTVTTLSCWLLASSIHQARAEAVDGMSGVLDVIGELHNTPCAVDKPSAYQEVNLGTVSRSQLLRPGDQGTPVAFQLRFVDCQRASGSIQSELTGNLVWSAYQPVVSVAFVAPADADDPRLVKVRGVTGMGLLLTDALGRNAALGSRGEPLFMQHGNDTQTWHVQPVRTSAALGNGAFRAAVDFRLVYE